MTVHWHDDECDWCPCDEFENDPLGDNALWRREAVEFAAQLEADTGVSVDGVPFRVDPKEADE